MLIPNGLTVQYNYNWFHVSILLDLVLLVKFFIISVQVLVFILLLNLQDNAHNFTMSYRFTLFFVSVENTRTVSKNLGCKTKDDGNVNTNRVDVLIPDVIQVLPASSFLCHRNPSRMAYELELRTVLLNLGLCISNCLYFSQETNPSQP